MKPATPLKLFTLSLALFTLPIMPPQFAGAHERHPLAMQELDWQAENIGRVYAMAGDFHAGALIRIWNMPGRVQDVEGKRCLVGPYFIFDVDDSFAFNIDETVTVELLFDAAQTDGFIISYDHASNAPQASTVMLERDGGERWQSVSVELERAGFANRRHGHTDLGVTAPGALLLYDAQADHEVVLCDMRIVREGRQEADKALAGTLSLHVRDGTGGDAVPARVGLYDAQGRMPAPGEQALVVPRFTDRWNLGFRLAPVAGSDFPYINLPGTERSYVRIDGPFSPQDWFEGLRQGRTFVTNGPMLSLKVADGTIGDTVAVEKGETLNITARAQVNPDIDSLNRVELVIHGDVAATAESEKGSESLTLNHSLTAAESCWIALRAYGKNGGLAHSAPVYVNVDGVQTFWNTAAVPALVEKYRNRIETLLNALPDAYDDLERWDTADLLEPAWNAQLPALRQHAGQVLERYDELLQRLD